MNPPATAQNIHASCVAVAGKGLLILGASGAGKSALSLQLIALGAQLVADDRTLVWAEDQQLIAAAPSTISGLIEARGLGILRLPACPRIAVTALVNLNDPPTTARMPPARSTVIDTISLDYLHMQSAPHFPSLLMCYLLGMRSM